MRFTARAQRHRSPISTSRSTCPACTTCSTRWPRSPWPEVGAPTRHRAGAGRVPRRRPPLPALWRDSPAGAGTSRWSTTTAITRWRWRPRSPPRAAPSPGAGWCSRSSRTATRARATVRGLRAVLSTADALLLDRGLRRRRGADRRRRRPRAGARGARGGKVEPVFVERSPICPRPWRRGARRRRGADHGRRLDRPGAGDSPRNAAERAGAGTEWT
jgi:hypothetical protein